MPNGVDHNAVVSLDTTHGIGTFDGGQYFTLSFAGCPLCRTTTTKTTGNIDWTQDTSGQSNINSLQSQLNGLTNIANSASDAGTLGVTVIRSDVGNNNEGYIFSITFQGLFFKLCFMMKNQFLGMKNGFLDPPRPSPTQKKLGKRTEKLEQFEKSEIVLRAVLLN